MAGARSGYLPTLALLGVLVLAGCGGVVPLAAPPAADPATGTVAVTVPPPTPVQPPLATRSPSPPVRIAAPSPTVPLPPVTPTRAPTLPATAPQPPASTATSAPIPTFPARARTIERGPATRRVVALTFDAGADRGDAERILDTLRDANVKATFGMTGRWAEQNPDLVQRMVAEGHLLMNHTYDHASFTGRSPGTKPLTAEERRREIERTETVIRALTGVGLRPYFRPPYGDIDEALAGQLGPLGYGYNVLWTVDSLGWDGYSAERIVARCVAGASPGAILLFHVGADSQDAAALPELIRRLRAAGYGFATIEELLR